MASGLLFVFLVFVLIAFVLFGLLKLGVKAIKTEALVEHRILFLYHWSPVPCSIAVKTPGSHLSDCPAVGRKLSTSGFFSSYYHHLPEVSTLTAIKSQLCQLPHVEKRREYWDVVGLPLPQGLNKIMGSWETCASLC